MRNIGIVAQLHLGIATMPAQYKTYCVFLKMSPNHPGIAKDPSMVLRLRAAYDTLMAAMVVAGIVS